MADDVLVNKAATVERCVARAREEYANDPATFASDFTRQDAATLNVQRACEAARDVFELMAHQQWIEQSLAEQLKRMVAFRNIAVHDYQTLLLPILVSVITNNLDVFLEFTKIVLLREG